MLGVYLVVGSLLGLITDRHMQKNGTYNRYYFQSDELRVAVFAICITLWPAILVIGVNEALKGK